MLEISFKINGKEVNPNNMGNALEDAMLQEIVKSIKNSIGTLRCSEHNKSPKVIVKGRNYNNLSMEVSGCCDSIIKKATDRLN